MTQLPSYMSTTASQIEDVYHGAKAAVDTNLSESSVGNLSAQAGKEGFGNDFAIDSHAKGASLDSLNAIENQLGEQRQILDKIGTERAASVAKNHSAARLAVKY